MLRKHFERAIDQIIQAVLIQIPIVLSNYKDMIFVRDN